jgi:PAS domain S-box-containing protein
VNEKPSELQQQNIELSRNSELNNRRFVALFEHTNDGIFISNPEGIHIDVNEAALEMLGYRRDEVIGQHYSKFTDPDESSGSSEVLRRLLAGEKLPVYERTFVRKDGSRFTAENNVAVVRDIDGSILQFQSVIRDVSERKELTARLKAAVEEREMMFVELNQRIENNLSMIQGMIQMQLSTVLDNAARGPLTEVAQRIEALALMHRKLRRDQSLGLIELPDFLDDLIAAVAVLRQNRRVIIEPRMTACRIAYSQALNIALLVNEALTNCLKHAFADDQPDPLIRLNLGLRGHELEILVEDNGRGFPPGFSPRNADGTGFQIMRSLTAQLNGTLEAGNIVDGGAKIRFALPVEAE